MAGENGSTTALKHTDREKKRKWKAARQTENDELYATKTILVISTSLNNLKL
jgi:hypothetical protein